MADNKDPFANPALSNPNDFAALQIQGVFRADRGQTDDNRMMQDQQRRKRDQRRSQPVRSEPRGRSRGNSGVDRILNYRMW